MKIVGNQQHTAIQPGAYILDQFVERDFAIEINTLNRFIKHKEFRGAKDGTRQQDPLEFAAGQFAHLGLCQMIRPGQRQRLFHLSAAGPVCQPQKPVHSQRQGPVDLELLRYIAGAQVGLLARRAFIRVKNAKRHLRGCGFARSVGPDQRDDLTGLYAHRNATHQPSV